MIMEIEVTLYEHINALKVCGRSGCFISRFGDGFVCDIVTLHENACFQCRRGL
jgi:hypothetical protein